MSGRPASAPSREGPGRHLGAALLTSAGAINTTGERSPITMSNYTNVLTTTPAVHDDGAHYTASGMAVPAADVRSREIAEQGARWLAFSEDRTRMKRPTLVAKALSSVAFSVQHGARSLAVPSKLVGTRRHQRALAALVRDGVGPWTPLGVEARGGGLTATHSGELLGTVQPKHLPWCRPLLAHGLTLHLARVTGAPYGYTLGVNIAFGNVGTALAGLLEVLGKAGGDGASEGPGTPALSVADADAQPTTGDAQSTTTGLSRRPPLRLVVRPEHDAVRPGADPDDVVLYRRLDGTACCSVDHVVRHSPTGIDWGRTGSGPADLALSVLVALTNEDTAERLYTGFEADVVARVPYAGGVLRAADVRRWVALQSV